MTRHPRRGDRTPVMLDAAHAFRTADDIVTAQLAAAFTAEIDRQVEQHGETQRFEVLHYLGDLSATILPGQVLGADEFGRPYEVLDTEVDPVLVDGHHDGDGCLFPTPGHLRPRTTVFLQYATPETLAAGFAQLLGGAQ